MTKTFHGTADGLYLDLMVRDAPGGNLRQEYELLAELKTYLIERDARIQGEHQARKRACIKELKNAAK